MNKNKTKIIFMAFGMLMFAVLLFSVAYMTNFAHIRVIYSRAGGVLQINPESVNDDGMTNQTLYNFLVNHAPVKENWETFKMTIYNFHFGMSDLNTFIMITALVGIVCFAALLICSNHSRRVYYKSNLVCGILAPLTTIIFTVICLVKNLSLMSVFNKNIENFNCVAMIQNPLTYTDSMNAINDGNISFVTDAKPCNSLTFILFTILFAIVIIYSVVVMVASVKKYKDTTELRNEIIRRAVENNG